MIKAKKENKGSLTDAQLKTLKRECAEELAKIRHRVLVTQPFCGSVAMRFNLVPVRDKRCLTACTDYKNIYWNIDFLLSLTSNERQFVMLHEIWHCLNLTSMRRQTRHAELWNIATDMEINNIISTADGCSAPVDVLFPPDGYAGKSAETIYDFLLNQPSKNDNKNDGSHGLSGQFDKHIYSDDTDNSTEKTCDRWGEMGYDEDFCPSISEDTAERIREAAISAAQTYAREHGDLPGNVQSLINKFTKPEIDWRDYLCSFVSSIPNGKRTWLPPSRRHIHNDMYFQSRRTEIIRVCVCIDTSGSCLDDLPKFFGELKGLIETFPSYEIDVIQADAAVDRVDHYDTNNPIPLEYDEQIDVYGGGGTDYGPAFEYIDENLDPDCVIYLGDGEAAMSYDGPPNYPVLFMITKNGSFDFCDWGKKIRFKESSWD